MSQILLLIDIDKYHIRLHSVSATNHGKGPCDRIAAIIKRATRNESLRGAGRIITDAKQMSEFCTAKFDQDKIKIIYVGDDEIEVTKPLFQERYSKFEKSIPGTRMYHRFVPTTGSEILCYRYSDAPFPFVFDFRIDETPMVSPDDLEIGKFYAFVDQNATQVGMLVDFEDGEVEFQAMRMNKGNKRCKWPRQPVTRIVVLLDVLLKINDPVYNTAGKYFDLQTVELDALKIRFTDYKKRLKRLRDRQQAQREEVLAVSQDDE